MSKVVALAVIGGAFIVRLGALALDCLCCVICRGQACSANSDCPDGCSCVAGQCLSACASDEDCPNGYICINDVCTPVCQGEQCAGTADCTVGCSCVDGQCWPNSDLYFCVWSSAPETQEDPDCDPDAGDCAMRRMTRQEIFDCENDPECKDTLPDRNCQRGKPEDEGLIHDGPFLAYAECCGRDCKCMYRCQPDTSCVPWQTGEYDDQNVCNQNCGLPDDVGACCETRRLRDENDDVYRFERGPAADPCPRTRATCVSEEDISRSFLPTITDCSRCPTTLVGACCTANGCVDMSTVDPTKPIDRFECENTLNGEFKTTWVDCRQPRDQTITTQFACPDCNGRFDCDCAAQDHCVNRQCVPCLDQVIEIPLIAGPAWHDTGVAVNVGDTVTLVAKRCDALEWGTTIRSQVGNGLLRTGLGSDEYAADDSGSLLIRLEGQGQPAAGWVCVSVTPSQACAGPLQITYDWGGTNQGDLDTATEFLGVTYGFACDNAGQYVSWPSGDKTGVNEAEVAVVDFLQAFADGAIQGDEATISLGAHWYFDTLGSGPARVIASCGAISQSVAISPPAGGDGCASASPVGSILVRRNGSFTLAGNPLP